MCPRFVWAVIILVLGANYCNASLINKVVLQSLNLTESDSFIDTSAWDNNGFEVRTRDWNASPALLENDMQSLSSFLFARNKSELTTVLHNFNHSFLSVRFLSLIGNSEDLFISEKRTIPTPFTLVTNAPDVTTSAASRKRKPESHVIQISQSQSVPKLANEESPAPAPAPQPAIITSTVTGPNNSSTSHIIQITLEHAEPPEPVTPTTTTTTTVPPEPDEETKARVKRELDSGEISQVHEIVKALSSPSNNGTTWMVSTSTIEGTNSTVLITTTTSAPEPETSSEKVEKSQDDEIVSVRRSGFSLLVNDQVVFDPWNGIGKSPSMMGNTIHSFENQGWNETNIFIDMGSYVPHRDVKISFEWEPVDSAGFLLLNEITLGTLEGTAAPATATTTTTTEKVEETEQNESSQGTTQQLHNNITLFIVVKSQTEIHNNGSIPQSTSVNTAANLTALTLNEKTEIPESLTTTTTKPKILNRDPSFNGRNSDFSAIIVFIILAVITFIICVGLIHAKWQLRKKQGSNCTC